MLYLKTNPFHVVIKQINTWFVQNLVRAQSGGCPMRIFSGQRSSSNTDVRTFWYKKLPFFPNLWCVRKDRGVEPVRTFFGQGGWSIFRDFVGTSFMDGPL